MGVDVHETADVSSEAKVGEGTFIWHQAQVREGPTLGWNCRLGEDVYIDKNVTVGDDWRIQNAATVNDGVTPEDDVFVGPHVVFPNDLYPRARPDDWTIVPTLVKAGASLGANATILCGVTVGSYTVVAAGDVVTRDVFDHAQVARNPARNWRHCCDCDRPLDENLHRQRDDKTVRIEGA